MTARLIDDPGYKLWYRRVATAWRRFDRLALEKGNRAERSAIAEAWNDYIAVLSERYPECSDLAQ